MIPEEAVMPQGDKLLVNLLVDGKVERREVTLGKRFDGLVEVREGLQGDETIISAGWQRVREGLAVRSESRGAPAVTLSDVCIRRPVSPPSCR